MKTVNLAKFLPGNKKDGYYGFGTYERGKVSGFNALHDIAERTEVGLDEDKVVNALQAMFSPNYIPGHTHTGHNFTTGEIAKAICTAFPELLVKVEKPKEQPCP